MKKITITLITLLAFSPILLSGKGDPEEWKDPYPDEPGICHCYHIGTGELIPTAFAIVSFNDSGEKNIEIYPCPKGLWYSCSVKTYVQPGSEDECDCLKKLTH